MSPTSQSTQNLDDQLALEAEQVTHSLPDLRQRWLDSQGAHNPSRNDIAFSYAVLLIKSSNKKDNKLGMSILMDLIDLQYHVEDCLYSWALGLYRLKDYEAARSKCELLLRMSPDTLAAQRLHEAIRDKQSKKQRDAQIGAAAVAAGIFGGLAVAAAILGGAKRR